MCSPTDKTEYDLANELLSAFGWEYPNELEWNE